MSPVEATDHIKRVLNKVDLRTSQEKIKDEHILQSKRILEKEEQERKKMAEAEGNLLNPHNEAAINALHNRKSSLKVTTMVAKEFEEHKKVYSVKVVEEFNEFFNLKQELKNLNK